MAYDFRTLSPNDFEDLIVDLLAAELALKLESFSPGPDGGIDGRYSAAGGDIIIQAKHYINSSFSSLKTKMKAAVSAVTPLKPKRYILATSAALTPNRKRELAAILKPFGTTTADIYGTVELNRILRKNPEIEKSHIKLWLSSTAVLERILQASTHSKTIVTQNSILRKLKIFVPNKSFNEAGKILEESHVLIISGAPGVGKTTLAEMLAHLYVGNQYQLLTIDDLESGFGIIDDTVNQVFYFDDFLGKVKLSEDALRHKDSQMTKFIQRVQNAPKARFVLTTREYILQQARSTSEHYSEPQFEVLKYILDVGKYTRKIRAQILYNHLLHTKLSTDYINSLVCNASIIQIIDHENFNPRLIEWMTDEVYTKDIAVDQYQNEFIDLLDHPERLWSRAFEKQITAASQNLLITLFFLDGNESIGILRRTYDGVHRVLSENTNNQIGLKDFETSLREIEGSFIVIEGGHVSYINPSISDFLSSYLSDPTIISWLTQCCPSAEWVRSLWRYLQDVADELSLQRIDIVKTFSKSAEKIPSFPTLVKDSSGQQVWRVSNDLSYPDRISLLVDWWKVNEAIEFSRAISNILARPSHEYTRWGDADDLLKIYSSISSPDSESLDLKGVLKERIITIICELLIDDSLSFDELQQIQRTYSQIGTIKEDRVGDALLSAISNEIETIQYNMDQFNSMDELAGYESELTEISNWANLDASDAITAIHSRMDTIEESIEPSTNVYPKQKLSDSNTEFSDLEISNLFQGIIDYRSN